MGLWTVVAGKFLVIILIHFYYTFIFLYFHFIVIILIYFYYTFVLFIHSSTVGLRAMLGK